MSACSQAQIKRKKAHVDVLGDLDVTVGERLQECRLAGTVLTQKTVPLTVVQGDFRAFDQQTTVEGEGVLVDFDITTLGVGYKDTVLIISISFSPMALPSALTIAGVQIIPTAI